MDAVRPRARSPRRASGRAVPSLAAGTIPRTASMFSTPADSSATTMPCPSVAGRSLAASATVASGGRTSGVSHRTGCSLTQRIAASSCCRGMSCGSTPRPPRRAIDAASRGPVTEFMFADTSGMVALVPSPGDRSTSSRLATDERRGTRKTSEYVRSTTGCSP